MCALPANTGACNRSPHMEGHCCAILSLRVLRPGIKGEREGRLEIKRVKQKTAVGLGFDCAWVSEQSLELIRCTDVMLSREAVSIKAFPCLRARVKQSEKIRSIRVPQTGQRSFGANHRVLGKL